MKKLLKILILLLLSLLVNKSTLVAQSDRAIPSRSATSFQILEQNFTQGQLSATNLKAFELRATQKIKDFADYVNLINDPQLNTNFKTRSGAAALKLFVADSAALNLVEKNISISNFLKEIQANTTEKTTWSFQNFTTSTTPQWTDNLYYHWQTSCVLTQTNEQNALTKTVLFNIYLKKIEKKFGTNSKTIWKVFLGDME